MPLLSIHSTSLIPRTPTVVVELGERALPPPEAVAWPQIVYGEIVLPQHTQRYTYYRVRGSHVLLLSVSVGRLVVCVFVYGLLLLLSTHTPGIAVCAAALPRLPPFIRRRLCIWQALNSIMPCLCVDARDRLSYYLWCLAHPRHHQLSPTPAHACI